MPIIRNCLKCGKEFRIKPYRIKKGEGKYCSLKCFYNFPRAFTKECLTCNKIFRTCPSRIKIGEGKYCSQKCAPHLGMKGKKHTQESKIKMKNVQQGNKNSNWKGDNVGYHGLHARISRKFGQPKFCSECGMTDKSRKYHWANISKHYKKDNKDFKRLCVRCHRIFDRHPLFKQFYT